METLDVGSIPSEGKIVSIIRWRRHEEGQLSDPQKGTKVDAKLMLTTYEGIGCFEED